MLISSMLSFSSCIDSDSLLITFSGAANFGGIGVSTRLTTSVSNNDPSRSLAATDQRFFDAVYDDTADRSNRLKGVSDENLLEFSVIDSEAFRAS